ncbi:MAG TPA: SusC/RagA family TonB-linked outer membrane protein [Gemmatimonadales bacterium]|nr:SusC/RagA family TonB-linked outer membrane protein [Gemmatimonadales bacterium]
MKRSPAFTTLLRTGGIAALLALGAAKAQAQATITGRVTDTDGQPLGGAQVGIRELASFSATTATNGTYTIVIPEDRAKGQSLTLIARYLGKAPGTKAITINAGRQEVNFSLRADPLRLDELVVTGVNEATSTKKLGFAVGKVSADQLQETPGVTALSGLAGKVAGVRVVAASGEPGSAPSIRLRGATSISGSQEPLIIIDGTISRATLADIASEDIERIEVIKGAAASSLYGSDAANGVVQIFTKRGKSLADGKLSVQVRNEVGASFLTKRIPNGNATNFEVGTDGQFLRNSGGARISEPDGVADNPYPKYFDHQAEILHPGVFYTNYLSIGQRRGSTNFNASFENTHTEGVIFGLKGFGRQNFRLNVDQQLTPRLDLEMSTFYGHSNNNNTAQGPGAPFFTVTFVEPNIDLFAKNPDGSPYRAFIPDKISNAQNPLYNLANEKRETERSRFTGGGRLRWRMLDWLTGETNYNFDQERDDFSDMQPFGYLSNTGQPTDGFLFRQAFTGRTYNLGATLTATGSWHGVTNTSKVSYIYEDETSNLVNAFADKLFVKQVPEFSSGDPSTYFAGSANTTIRNRNAFAITTFDIKDKYILDGLIRRDESSLFGPNSRRSYYGRVSGAWRANEDLKIKGFDEIRLRSSYGTAGLRPGFEYQYEVLSTAGGSFSKQTLGNKNLKPAHSAELEVGGNVEMGGGRFTLEYTYSQKKTKDQIILVDLPSVVGFTNQWQNVGALKSQTHELAMGYQLVNNRDMAWVINVTGDRTRQTITDWPLPEKLNSFGQQPQTFLLAQGAKLGIMYGNHAIRKISELYDDPAKKALSGAGQAWDPAKFTVNEEGYVVPLANLHCGDDLKVLGSKNPDGTGGTACPAGERPITYVTCKTFASDGSCTATTNLVRIGDANPDFNASFSSTFNYRRFSVTGLVDWSQGGNIYNGTRQWPFFDNRDRVYDQRGKPEAQKKSQTYYNYFYDGLNANDYFVEPGTYVKIKELSVNYTLVRDQLKKVGLGRLENVRLGVLGRNLFTFTKYSGYDPEVSGLVGDPFQFRVDWFQYPHFRTFTGLVEIAF